jgi:hypothetical protein
MSTHTNNHTCIHTYRPIHRVEYFLICLGERPRDHRRHRQIAQTSRLRVTSQRDAATLVYFKQSNMCDDASYLLILTYFVHERFGDVNKVRRRAMLRAGSGRPSTRNFSTRGRRGVLDDVTYKRVNPITNKLAHNCFQVILYRRLRIENI